MQPLVGGPRAGLSEAQVRASLEWKHSTRLRWGVDLLNSQLDVVGLSIEVTGGSVSWQWRAQPVDGQTPVQAQVRRTGTLTYRHKDEFNPLAVLYRPWVEMEAPPVNECPNPSFETDLTDWTVSGAGNTAEQVTTTAQDGVGAAKLSGTGAANRTFEFGNNLVPTEPGAVWSAGAYGKWDTGATPRNVRCDIRWYDSLGVLISSVLGASVATNTSTWVQSTNLNAVAPANTAFVAVRLVYLSPVANDAGLVDAVQLEPAGTLAPFGGSAWVRWHLGVFTATIPPYQYEGYSDQDGPVVWRSLDLADRSHFWQTDETLDPVTVTTGTDIVQWVKDDLAVRFNEVDVSGLIPDAPPKTASQDYVFDSGTPWLQVYNTLLGAIGNEPLHIDADGLAQSPILTNPTEIPPEHSYSFGTTVVPAANVQAVNPDLPNTIRFIARRSDPESAEEGDMILTLINQSSGPASVTARGGRTVLLRVEVDAQTPEELDAQAQALAPFYFGGGGLRYTGQVGLNPRHDDSDVVFLEKPAMDITGNWLVTSWQIQLGTADQMRVMNVEMEQLTGSAFVVVPDPPLGAYGTEEYGMDAYGGPV